MSMSPKEMLAAARIVLHRKVPYFTSIAFTLRPCEKQGIGTLGVDQHWRLYYDPEAVAKWGVQGTAAVLVHEVGHCIRRHFERIPLGVPEIRNWAFDTEINDDVTQMGFELPDDPITPEKIGCEPGQLAETYYEKLMEQARKSSQKESGGSGNGNSQDGDESGSQGQPAPGTKGCCCGGVAGNPADWEDAPGDSVPPPVEKVEQDIVRRQVAAAIREEMSKNPGNVPGSLQTWADGELTPPTIPWQKHLASQVRGSIAQIAGQVDYTRRRLSRRYGAMRKSFGKRAPLMPSMSAPIPDVGVVLDVSGSMMGDEIKLAMSEVIGIAKATGSTVTTYATDAEVAGVRKVRSVQDLKKLQTDGGGGGTDMGVGVREAVNNGRHNLIVILTDGYTPWPSKEDLKGTRLIVVLTPDGQQPPEWMTTINITQKEKTHAA